MKTNNVEDYQNLVIVLKKALEFYANKSNYDAKHPINNVLFSYIEMDCGSQAKFALEKIQELEKNYKNMEDDFVKNISISIQNNEKMPKILEMIEDFRKLNKMMDDISQNIHNSNED